MGDSAFNINLMGADAMIRLLSKAPAQALQYTETALFEEALEIIAEGQNYLTPVEHGTLAGSGTVLPPALNGNRISVTLGYGGPASAYAMYVHELLESPSGKPINWTKAGSGAKYLENPTRKAIPQIEHRIFRKLNKILKETR